MARWIASYILPLGDETPWIEGHGEIKKGLLIFYAKFWCLLTRYQLFPTALDNMLTWDATALVSSLMVEYSIDFVAILHHDIHDRAFEETTKLPFPCQKISGVDEMVLMIATMQIKIMKDMACLGLPRRSSEPTTVRRAQIEGPLVSTKPGGLHGGNVGVSVVIDIVD
ncbi:hypothetical protein FXO38_29284 [Capsicum annuum]|nr:hypothetical protein FXO38_29284 [Capsicum annuum]